MEKISIHPASKDDLKDVIEMIQELADFEKMSAGPKLKIQDLLRDGGYSSAETFTGNTSFESGPRPLFYCNVAEIQESKNENETFKIIIGYTISFYTYSTWEGKAMQLEDIYVRPQYRKIGAGQALFKAAVKFAYDNGCSRLDFHVLGWNPAKDFYNKMGAMNLTLSEEWEFCRMDKDKMEKLLKS